jgi:hypothetical protein
MPPSGTAELDGKWYDLAPEVAVTADLKGMRTTLHNLSTWWV